MPSNGQVCVSEEFRASRRTRMDAQTFFFPKARVKSKGNLFAAEMADEVALVGVHRVAVRDLLRLVRKPFRAVLALVGQRVVFGRVLVQMLLQLKVGLEAFAAELTRKHELLVLRTVPHKKINQ